MDVPPQKTEIVKFYIYFLSAGAGTGLVRVDHKKPSAGAVWVINDGSFCTLILRVKKAKLSPPSISTQINVWVDSRYKS